MATALLDVGRQWCRDTTLTPDTFVDLVVCLMREAQSICQSPGCGATKRRAVLRALTIVASENDVSPLVTQMIALVAPKIIDTMVAVARGVVDIGKHVATTCVSGCGPFC